MQSLVLRFVHFSLTIQWLTYTQQKRMRKWESDSMNDTLVDTKIPERQIYLATVSISVTASLCEQGFR